MKIGRVVVHPLRLPLPRPLRTAIHDIRSVDTVLVELHGGRALFDRAWRSINFLGRERPGIGLGLNRTALARYRA